MLTDAKIKAAKPRDKAYRLTDSKQLYLQVSPSGGKLWRMNYTWDVGQKKVQRTLAFGSYPAVTLSEARDKRDAAKRLILQGIEPGEHREANVDAEREARRNTFGACFEVWFAKSAGWPLGKFYEWVDARGGHWTKREAREWAAAIKPAKQVRFGPTHAIDIIYRFEKDVFPVIGDKPIRDLKAAVVLEVLQVIEARGAIETAQRVRQHVSLVFQSAVNRGLCAVDVAAGLLQELSPKPDVKPQPSIIDGLRGQSQRISAVRKLLTDCERNPSQATTKLALRFLMLTAVRPGIVRGARWDEFHDLEGADPHWIIPAARMKLEQKRKSEDAYDHPVPLPGQAVEMLRVLASLTGAGDLCFPGIRFPNRPMSENTLNAYLQRGGYFSRHTAHGCRAAFSTIMNERPDSETLKVDRLAIDLMLGHQLSKKGDEAGKRAASVSSSESAYNRAVYMPRRRELAQQWADIVTEGLAPPGDLIGRRVRYAKNAAGGDRR